MAKLLDAVEKPRSEDENDNLYLMKVIFVKKEDRKLLQSRSAEKIAPARHIHDPQEEDHFNVKVLKSYKAITRECERNWYKN